MKKLKDIDYKIISELMKDAKKSDRKLAKVVEVSQSTFTRKRASFEKEKLLEFTAIPNLEKFGFEIMAFSFASWKPEHRGELTRSSEEFTRKLSTFLSKHQNIIFASTGRGFKMDRMFISVHKNYSDYLEFMREYEEEWGKYLNKHNVFVISLQSDNIIRRLTFKYLAEYMKKIA